MGASSRKEFNGKLMLEVLRAHLAVGIIGMFSLEFGFVQFIYLLLLSIYEWDRLTNLSHK